MKIAVIGGAGVRTPLLVNGLAQSDLPIDEIALYDVDGDRLSIVGSLARTYCDRVRTYDTVRAAVAGASFVFVSIRVGGIAARARDEATAIAHGVVGQETVGPGGFAMAMRTAVPALEYACLIADTAPDAWIINFSNPVGIVSQAMLAGSPRVIGICDTPTELFEETAHVLGLDAARCRFDYFGLNHLGWLREVYCDGVPRLAPLFDDPERLMRVYRTPLFDAAFLRDLRLLPTEYLYFYYRPQDALANMQKGSGTRGAAIAALNEHLFRDLGVAGADARSIYERYLAERSAGYMQLESGSPAPLVPTAGSTLTGYDKIALAVVHAIYFDTNAVVPLNVRNSRTLPDLGVDDVVEVPCVVNESGAHPQNVDPGPGSVRDLIVFVKEYERRTLRAAASRQVADAVNALAANPLVGERSLAARLVRSLEITGLTEDAGSPQRRGGAEKTQ